MERFEAPDDLDEVVPDGLLGELQARTFFLIDNLEHVAAVGVLHDQAQAVSGVFEESFLVADDVRVLDTREDAHLIQRVLALFAAQFVHFHLFHGVDDVVRFSVDQVDFREGALA